MAVATLGVVFTLGGVNVWTVGSEFIKRGFLTSYSKQHYLCSFTNYIVAIRRFSL